MNKIKNTKSVLALTFGEPVSLYMGGAKYVKAYFMRDATDGESLRRHPNMRTLDFRYYYPGAGWVAESRAKHVTETIEVV